MSSRSRPLPNIPVKLAPIRKVLSITAALEARMHAYIAYYTAQQGLDPQHAPSDADTIVALVENFLDHDRDFNRYLRSGSRQVSSASATNSNKKVSEIQT